MEHANIYLCKADCSLLGTISGIKTETCQITKNLTDFWELTFEVERYTDKNGTLVQSSYYDSINTLMKIYFDSNDVQMFFVINTEPAIAGDGYQETKTVTAHSIECELNNMFLKNFKINCGTKDSQEYLATDSNNTAYNINPYTELPYEYISLVNYRDPQLSLMHLALQNTGWTVKTNIDPEICQIKKSFDISSSNIYAFLMETVSPTASVLFEFDRKHKQIGMVKLENSGEDTGIFVTMRNLMNHFEVSGTEDNIITKLTPNGADNLGIEYVNFGKDYIINLDYFMDTINEYSDYKYVSTELHNKYHTWKDYRDNEQSSIGYHFSSGIGSTPQTITLKGTRRELYKELSKLYNQTILDISERKNRVPNDGASIDYKTYSLEELKISLNAYNQALAALITIYKNEYGVTQIGNAPNYTPTPSNAVNIKDTPYWYDFYAYKESIIPKVEQALKMYCQTDENGNLMTDNNGNFIELEFGNPDYYADSGIVKEVDSYKYEWSLYGLDELESKKKAWSEAANLLFDDCFIQSGTITNPTAYRTPNETGWNSLSETQKKRFTSQSAYIEKLNQYLDYMSFNTRDNSLTKTKCKGIIRQCDDAIRKIKNEISLIEQKQDWFSRQRREIANSVTFENFKVNNTLLFTEKDLNVINSMIREDEYTNDNILITSLDDIVTTIDVQEELYQSAIEKLYEISQPQYSFHTELDNIYALDEFQYYQKPFEIGNFIRVSLEIHEEICDNKFIKLRLVSITYNPIESDENLSVEFSTIVKAINGISDLGYFLGKNNSSSGGSTSSGSSSSDGTYGNNNANVQISNNMLNALLNTELFGTTVTDVILDSLKSNKGNFNTLFSHSGIFDSLEAGRIKISGTCLFDIIKSSNYVEGKSGSMLNLIDGSFSFASGALSYNPDKGLVIQGVASDDSVNNLSTSLDNLSKNVTNTFNGLTDGKTTINGGCIKTGNIISNNWNGNSKNLLGNTIGSILCLSDGKFSFGGGKLKWDGTSLSIEGTGKFTGEIIANKGTFNGEVNATSGTFNGDVTANTLTANESGTIAGWTFNKDGFSRENDSLGNSFSQSLGANGVSISDFFFVQPEGFAVTDPKFYERIRSYQWSANEQLESSIYLQGTDNAELYNGENCIYIYAYGNEAGTINISGKFKENFDQSEEQEGDKTITVSESMLHEKINNYIKICMTIDDIFFGYHFDDATHYPSSFASINSIGLYDNSNRRIGIFKIEVFSSITDKVKRTIFLNNIRTQNDFILNSLFGQISLKTMDIYPQGINAFSEFELNIYSNDSSNTTPEVTISSSKLKHSGIYNAIASSGSQLRISDDGTFFKDSSSSRRYKKDITSKIPTKLNPNKLYDLNVVSYKYNDDYLPVTDQRYNHDILGFIAEDVYEKYPEACNLNKNGKPEMWNINILFPAALKLIQDQHKELQTLKRKVKALKKKYRAQ